MSTQRKTIVKGNTGTLYKVGVQGNPDLSAGGPDYTCVISVPTAVPPISRAVTLLLDANTRFAVQLTPAETDTLQASRTHTMAVQVNNATTTPPFVVETPIEFYVQPQLIP